MSIRRFRFGSATCNCAAQCSAICLGCAPVGIFTGIATASLNHPARLNALESVQRSLERPLDDIGIIEPEPYSKVVDITQRARECAGLLAGKNQRPVCGFLPLYLPSLSHVVSRWTGRR